MHKPIRFTNLSLSFPHKTCFSDFNGTIFHGERIAIIGPNGAGKSTLLKILQGTWTDYEGNLFLPDDLQTGYLPQIIDGPESFSGGERLHHALTKALANTPNLLLLDEPTNHLDKSNRRALISHLRNYKGTLIMVSHDMKLLKNCAEILWHIQHEKLTLFKGAYEDYQREMKQGTISLEEKISRLQQQKKEMHRDRMKEQERGKRKRIRGEKNIEQRKWPTIRSHTKLGNSVKTANNRLNQIQEEKKELLSQMAELFQPEVIGYKFELKACTNQKSAISIQNASLGFSEGSILLNNIDFHLGAQERIAICGDNGSGKSAFVKALMNDDSMKKTGIWMLPNPEKTGYLDQHYQNLDPNKTVLEMLAEKMPQADHHALRKHLNDFLFRKNEALEALVANLSGGEKARLSLCCIAASPPALLILDEMTNNLDLETREHIIQILNNYPAAMIVISHDSDFLQAINIETCYRIHQGQIEWQSLSEETV